MQRLIDLEGVLIIDNRESPGIPEAELHKAGLPTNIGRGQIELPTYTCSHCHAQVIMNPKRTRDRGFCRKCSRVVCDSCEARRVASGGECMPLNALIDEMRERDLKQGIVI